MCSCSFKKLNSLPRKFCHGKVMLFKTGKANCAVLPYAFSGAMLTTPVGARQF